jgi:hypothetical protein
MRTEYRLPMEDIVIGPDGLPGGEFGPRSSVTHPGVVCSHLTECRHAAFMREVCKGNEKEFLHSEAIRWQVHIRAIVRLYPHPAELIAKGVG